MLYRILSALVAVSMIACFVGAPIIGGGKKDTEDPAAKGKDSAGKDTPAQRDKDATRDKSGIDKNIFRDKDIPKVLEEKDTIRDKDKIKDIVKEKFKNTHTGVVVSVKKGQLVMESMGKQHTHLLAPTGKVVLSDGKEGKLRDLSKGQMIRVITAESNPSTAVLVEALPKK